MTAQDRVISTGALRSFTDDDSGALAVAGGLLDRLDPDGLHVLVPMGPAPVPGELLICELQLDTGGATPTPVPVLVPAPVWSGLPTAFAVVSAAARLVPSVLDAWEAELTQPEPLDRDRGELEWPPDLDLGF